MHQHTTYTGIDVLINTHTEKTQIQLLQLSLYTHARAPMVEFLQTIVTYLC